MQKNKQVDFKDIADSIPGLVYQMRFRKDGSRYWSYLSPAGIEILGLEADYIGTDILAAKSSEEERLKLLKSIEYSVKTLSKWEYEFPYLKHNGDTIWLHCTGMPIADGNEISMNGVLLDITEKKKTEILLAESEEKFTKAFSRTPNPAYITTIPGGIFLEVNDSFCSISGYSRDELIGKSVLEFNFYKSTGERDALMKKLASDKKLANYRIDFRTNSGNFRECAIYSEMIEIGGSPSLVTIIHDQTEENAARKALLSSESWYRSLFENASDGISLMKDYMYFDCNPKMADMFMYSDTKEIKGKSPEETSPEYQPDGRKSKEAAKKYIDRALEGEPQSFEWLHKRSDGSDFFVEIKLSKIELGDETFVLAFLRDISSRKLIENELIDLQVYLQLQIEKMPIGLVIWDTDFKAKSWNPSAERIFGFTEEEALGKHPYDLIVPIDLKEDLRKVLSSLLEGDESVHSTNENITKTGRRISCQWSNTPFKTSDGEKIGVLSMVQDVTDQRKAEAELKTYQNYLEDLVRERTVELEVANTNLDERERSVRLLSEITSASNLSADPEEAIFFAIERFSGHTGWPFGHMVYVDHETGKKTPSGIWYSRDHISNKGIAELLMKCRFESKDCPINKAISSRKPQTIINIKPYACEVVNHLINDYGLSNSYVFPVEIENKIVGVIQFLYVETGVPGRRYDELASQISIQLGMAIERKRIGDELMRAKGRAEEASRSKSQFLANMSHEIRTPMNSILGFADILSTRLAEERNLSYLDSIRSSGTSLMQILNDILDLSKVEAGKMVVEKLEVSMDSFFDDILNLFRQNIKDKGLDLDICISDKLPEVIVTDKLRLRQIVINLLSNAVKFTDSGSIEFRVEIADLNKESFTLKISIEDTGVGISEEFKEHLFDTFRQEEGDSSRGYEGTGLGLAITKRLVDILDGEFVVESEKGKGSKFIVILKNLEIVEGIAIHERKKTITPDMIKFRNKKVLLVEDNPDDQNFFRDMMVDVGLEVSLASNGEEALEKLESEPVDLLISDIRMPVMDGYELLEKLKSNIKEFNIPVVAITASAMKEDIARIESHDFKAYLLKPVQMSDFYSCLMDLIPYEEINYRAKIEKMADPEELSVEARAKLPELIEELESSYKKEWQKLSKKQAIQKVQHFGMNLRKLGQDMDIEIIRIYGESLLASVDSFNVEAIKKDINNFPKLVKKLKSINEKEDE